MENVILNPYNENVFVLGATGSGKSTLISTLMGAELKYEKVKFKYHISNGEKGKYPEIGNSFKSCTDIPGVYGNYIDSAGFLDSKGQEQEIINSYATAKLFQRGSKTKIVVVIEWASLQSSRGKTIVDVANRLLELFPVDFKYLIHSIVLAVSKVDEQVASEDDLDDVIEQVNEIVSSNDNITDQARMVVKTLVEKKSVVLFPLPQSINAQVIDRIKNKIAKTRTCILTENASVSLS